MPTLNNAQVLKLRASDNFKQELDAALAGECIAMRADGSAQAPSAQAKAKALEILQSPQSYIVPLAPVVAAVIDLPAPFINANLSANATFAGNLPDANLKVAIRAAIVAIS